MKIQEVIDAIDDLNNQYYEHSSKFEEHCPFVATCTGYQIMVKFFGLYIWDLDNDDREFDFGSNCPSIPIKEHLVRKATKLQNTGILSFKLV